jgi:hypothetical protein
MPDQYILGWHILNSFTCHVPNTILGTRHCRFNMRKTEMFLTSLNFLLVNLAKPEQPPLIFGPNRIAEENMVLYRIVSIHYLHLLY